MTDLGIAIVSGELPEGVPLPIESELGKRLGVSRTVVREATKVLASKGLLRSRPKVGTVPLPRVSWDVLDPEVLGWMLDHGPIADVIRDVSEVRLIIEPAAARLAAMRRSEEEAERLRVLTDDLVGSADDDERYVVTDLDFHAAILSATKNATLVRLTGAIGAALRASRRVTVHAPGGPQSAMAEHEAVARAVIDGDPVRAYDRMTELIVLTQSHIEWVLAHDDPSPPSHKDVIGRATGRGGSCDGSQSPVICQQTLFDDRASFSGPSASVGGLMPVWESTTVRDLPSRSSTGLGVY